MFLQRNQVFWLDEYGQSIFAIKLIKPDQKSLLQLPEC